jgi:cytidylate kinase
VIFLAIITISRQLGSFGSEAAELLAKQLGMRLILKDTVLNEWMADVVNDHQLRMLTESPKFYLNIMHDGITYKEYIERKLMDEASRQPSIIVGMGSQLIFRDHPGAVRVRIVASDNTRTERIRRKYGFGVKEAEQMIQQSDKKHKRYISTLYGVDWAETFNYDMVLNTDGLTAEQCADMIALLAESKDRAGASGALADAMSIFLHRKRGTLHSNTLRKRSLPTSSTCTASNGSTSPGHSPCSGMLKEMSRWPSARTFIWSDSTHISK